MGELLSCARSPYSLVPKVAQGWLHLQSDEDQGPCMRFVTWNVGHQTLRKPLPTKYAHALGELEPDVLVLTEYVAHESHGDFISTLSDHGLNQVVTTDYVPRQNQVLIASRHELTRGTVECCELTPATVPNWLHVSLDDGLEVVGLRVPMFRIPGGRALYWQWLRGVLPSLAGRPCVLLGDFNASPKYRPLKSIIADGWQLVTPDTGWSFCGHMGKTAAIDSGLVTRHFRPIDATYIQSGGGCCFGCTEGSYSDHAVLAFQVERTDSPADD